MRISISWTRRGSSEHCSAHQSGRMARCTNAGEKPALESRRIKVVKDRRVSGLRKAVVASDLDSRVRGQGYNYGRVFSTGRAHGRAVGGVAEGFGRWAQSKGDQLKPLEAGAGAEDGSARGGSIWLGRRRVELVVGGGPGRQGATDL